MLRVFKWVVVVVLATSAVACGSDAEPGQSPSNAGGDSTVATTDAAGAVDNPSPAQNGGGSTTGSELELTDAATAAFVAFLTGDNQAYFEALSRECREELEFPAVNSHLDGRRFRTDLANIDLSALSVANVSISGFDGSTASVSLDIDGTSEIFRENLATRWVHQDGSWRMAECADIDPAANDLSAEGITPEAPLEYGFIADMEGWLLVVTWVDLDDEDIVLELGGDPSSPGHQLVTAQLSMSYVGAEPTVRYGDTLSFDMVNDSNIFGDDASCETDQYGTSADASTEIRPGDSALIATVCREVPEEAINGLLLRVTHDATDGHRYFELKQN